MSYQFPFPESSFPPPPFKFFHSNCLLLPKQPCLSHTTIPTTQLPPALQSTLTCLQNRISVEVQVPVPVPVPKISIAQKVSTVTVFHRAPSKRRQSLADVIAAGPSRPVSEVERGHHDTQAGSLAVNPPSTVTGPGDGEVLDPAIPSNPPSRLEERPGDVDSGPGTSSNVSFTRPTQEEGTFLTRAQTGPTVTESDVLENQENPHSPTAAAAVRPPTPEAPDAGHPPIAAIAARPPTPEAPRARQARKTYCWAILIFGLIVTTLTLSCGTGYKSSSVDLQKLYGSIFQAGVGVMSICLGACRATQQVIWLLPIMDPAPRHSSGKVLGAGLGDIYSNLSQSLAAGNSLYPVPSLISKKRIQASRFQLPEWSLTIKPLSLFLQQTVHIDEFLLFVMLSLGKTADIALRQQQLTGDTLRSIQDVEYMGIIQPWRKILFGTSDQESQLQTRLAHHLYFLNETITETDEMLRKVLGEFIVLASTAETIRDSTIQDRERYLGMKEETASQLFWAFRASIYALRFSEPEHLAKISQNIELADDIYEWAQDIVDVLQRATLHLQCAKTIVGSLIRTLHEFGTITWDVADKDHKIQEFLALIWKGQQLLTYSREAFVKLQWAGHI